MIIKKVITAVGTNELNSKLKEKKVCELIGNDIPYQEGVLDILRGNSEVNVLILSETLIGEYEIKEFINIIKKINPYLEIIFFMENDNFELKTFLQTVGISKICVDNEISIDEIEKFLSYSDSERDLSIEIEKLKKIIEEKQKPENVKIKKDNKIINKSHKIIAISGGYGSGKSIFTALLGRTCQKQNLHSIIIDFDIFNNSINTMFRVPKFNNNYKIIDNINQFITKINNYIDIFCGVDNMFNENNKINFEKIKELFEELKRKYDVILIDTSSEINLKYIRMILANSDKILFLIEPNLLEIKKAEELLEVYVNDWEIPNYKFNIILNKVNVNSIDEEIIKKLFNKIKIIEKINFSKQYTAFANDTRFSNIKLGKYQKILKKVYK